MRKIVVGIATAVITVFTLPAMAFAHVVVTPNQVGIGARTLFDVSVPNEKEVVVNKVKLDIPGNLQDVRPNVLAGWDISTAKDKDDNVTSITWTGNIPVGQRADLMFKAQTPANVGELDWKAYQTYADGTVVHWDQKPNTDSKDDDSSDTGPYSVTKVVNDLDSGTPTNSNSTKETLALNLSVVAIAFSVISLFLRRRK